MHDSAFLSEDAPVLPLSTTTQGLRASNSGRAATHQRLGYFALLERYWTTCASVPMALD
jgi:hypothetical protein